MLVDSLLAITSLGLQAELSCDRCDAGIAKDNLLLAKPTEYVFPYNTPVVNIPALKYDFLMLF